MRAMIYLALLLAAGSVTPPARADIYFWIDADGVRHISNLSPPPHAQVFLKTAERPPEDIRLPREAERQAQLRRAEAELRRRQERMAQREADLERRFAAAEQRNREALEEAQDRLAAAEARYAEARQHRRYGLDFIYVARPFGHRHHPHKHWRHPAGRRYPAPSFEGRPFHLGAVHIPLVSARDLFRRPPAATAKFGGSRHADGGHAKPPRRRGR